MHFQRLGIHSIPNVRDYLIIIAGMAVYAIGFTAFILPHEIVIGGMAGFSTLVYFASGGLLPVAVTMYATNILMLVCWYKSLGRQFVVGTVFGATILSAIIGLIEGYFTSHPPLVSDPTMSVLMGSVVCGIGIGLYYSHKGSAGGTDIVAAIFEKKLNISIGRTMMIIDVAIVTCSFFLPFDGDMDARIQSRVQTIIYGWTSIVIYSLVANYMVNADKQTIQFFILSPKWEDIADRIAHECGRGVTSFDGKGLWTGENRTMLVVWCRQYDADHIYSIVQRIDESAYIIQSKAKSVYGNGFDRLHTKSRKVKK
ncbi:MAG: YitT family protein [Muribaculaceae bacterium]|nr:YitT family protein [Muribaculaceae bacterium]MDE5713397.1 YitT family protein [Muribaculaceae bacterium]